MNIIDERDERTKKRKIAKAKFDEIITLSATTSKGTVNLSAKPSGDKIRLLDEGMIVYADGSPDFYIQKGTINKYLDGGNVLLTDSNGKVMNLTDDYVGSINIGHLDFASFPVGIVGSWTKKSLSAVTDDDGRTGLDVQPDINEEHPLVKALRIQGIPVGVSVEMYLHFNEKASEEYGVGIVDEIFISDFAIVGECGNVGSSETILKGGDSVEDTKNLAVETEELIEEATEEVVEEAVEETEEAVEETVNLAEEQAEEEEIEEGIVEEAECDEEDADEEDVLEKAMESVKGYQAEIERLRAENKALKQTNKRLKTKLQNELDRKKHFIANLPTLSVDMGLQESEEKADEKEVTRYASNDGIGE